MPLNYIKQNYLENEKLRLEKMSNLQWVHWVVVVASLMITMFAYFIAQQQVESKAQIQFDHEARQVVNMVSERMQKYEDALWAGVAAVQANGGSTDVQHWNKFSSFLHIEQKYPGINGIGVVDYVPNKEALNAYLSRERLQRPDYHIHPEHAETVWFPITHIEPVALNKKAVGLDMSHELNRFTAAKKARDTGTAQITGPIILVQDSKRTPGFLFFAPFYKGEIPLNISERQKNMLGMVYAPFIMEKLMAGTLDSTQRKVRLTIRDQDDVLYSESGDSEQDIDPKKVLKKNIKINAYGRVWNLDIESKASSYRPVVRYIIKVI